MIGRAGWKRDPALRAGCEPSKNGRASWNRTSIADLEGLGPIR